MQLVSVQQFLVEGRVAEGQRTAFFYPEGRRFRGRDVDLAFPAGTDGRRQPAQDVFLIQHVDQAAVVFVRHQIAARFVDTLLQYIGYIAELGTDRGKHRLAVFIGSRAFLFRFAGRPNQGFAGRHGQLLVHLGLFLQAVDGLAHLCDVSLHLFVGFRVGSRHLAVLVGMLCQELLGFFPQGRAFGSQFVNAHSHSLFLLNDSIKKAASSAAPRKPVCRVPVRGLVC